MGTNKKILIIEDEKSMAQALELKLVHAGFEVKTVLDGEEGVEALRKEAFDLILLDLIMPKMDGFEVLKVIKEKKIKTPVFILSNLSQEEDEKLAKALGAKEFFVKSNTTISAIINRIILFFK